MFGFGVLKFINIVPVVVSSIVRMFPKQSNHCLHTNWSMFQFSKSFNLFKIVHIEIDWAYLPLSQFTDCLSHLDYHLITATATTTQRMTIQKKNAKQNDSNYQIKLTHTLSVTRPINKTQNNKMQWCYQALNSLFFISLSVYSLSFTALYFVSLGFVCFVNRYFFFQIIHKQWIF